ncbi:MAG: flagellar assembly protein FliW [Planctomycetota bacterium]
MDEQMTTTREAEMVTVSTVRFGEVEVPPERILEFPRGLVGLPQARRFVFLHDHEDSGPFFWMQSADDPGLAFVVCEPRHFFPEYVVPLSKEDQAALAVQDPEDGLVCVILVVPQDPQQITANLRGPLVVNPHTSVGVQLVLAGDEYPVRARLFAGSEGGAECSS